MKLNKTTIPLLLKSYDVDFKSEYVFASPRKFRFDFAIPDKMIAIEYEGVFNSKKSRHTGVVGYTNDCEKYNLAVLNGWRVLRYTAKNINQLNSDLYTILNDD